MQTIYFKCCGLDVHKNFITACLLTTTIQSEIKHNQEKVETEIREFSTFPDSLTELRNWLESVDCHYVAMESTGVYWFPVYETLEQAFDGDINLLVVNARHMRNVPGRKTDVKDAEWIASLLRFGLVNGSFVPPLSVRELRQLTRYRKSIVEDISTQKNRIEKTLQMSGFKLSTFLTDIFGVSGRNLINALIAKGQLSSSDIEIGAKHISIDKQNEIKRVITGKLSLHQRSFLKMQIKQLDSLLAHLETIEQSIDQNIAETTELFEAAIESIKTIPGISVTSATAIIAEIGTDMSKFPSAAHLCSWAGVSPSNNMSAGKKKAHR